MENVETMENRAPHDIDVVTFFCLPPGETQESLMVKSPDLFNHDLVKTTCFIDSYPFVLGNPLDSNQANEVVYWYSMWSHRRNGLWKGFLQIDLNQQHDSDAAMLLHSNEGEWHE
jgi:hypothetical protein